MKWKMCAMAALLGAAGLTGCTTVKLPDEAAAASYSMGWLSATEQASMERAWSATKSTLESLGISVTDEKRTDRVPTIVGRGAQDRRIVVQLQPVSDSLTQLKIHSGSSSDITTSWLILDNIRKVLAATR